MLRLALRRLAILSLLLGVVSVPASVARADTARSIAHYIMGVSYEFQEQLELAAGEYRRSVQADPSVLAPQMRLGSVRLQMGDLPAAIRAFKAAVDIDADHLEARYVLALAYGAAKDFDRAAGQYEFILKKFTVTDPKNAEYLGYLAQLYAAQGKVEMAVAQFERILTLQADNRDALLIVGSFYLEHGRRAEGFELLRRCLAAEPSDAACLNGLGYGYAQDGIRLDEAEGMIKHALVAEPDNAAYLDSLGWVYFKKGLLDEALLQLDKARAISDDPEIIEHIEAVRAAQPEGK